MYDKLSNSPPSFGQCVTSPIVRVGEKSNWKANYFPKGFTDPDYASLYVTNFDCENKGVDKQEPTKVTVSAFATVNVVIRPKPPPLGSGACCPLVSSRVDHSSSQGEQTQAEAGSC